MSTATQHGELGPSLSHDGLELFFSVAPSDTLYSARRDNQDGDFAPRQAIRQGLYPSVSSDGLSLYFEWSKDLWVMTRDAVETDWGLAESLGPTVNSPYHELDPSISVDGRELYFAANRPNGGVDFSVWVTTRETVSGQWEEPVQAGPQFSAAVWDGGPESSADGLTLFFCSLDRVGGYGGFDLWMATRETIDGEWGEPANLGPDVNTAQSEIDSYLSADGSELYFSRGNHWSDPGSFDLWRVPVISPPAEDSLQAGDADQNHTFDQLDLVRVLQADKYLTGESATWGEGDWDGAPGGSPANPPFGDGIFDQLDIIKALATGLYMNGPYAAVRPAVGTGDAQTSAEFSDEFVVSGLTVDGSRAGRSGLSDVDLVYAAVPEPPSILLVAMGVIALAACGARSCRAVRTLSDN